jgi:general stress protein 26
MGRGRAKAKQTKVARQLKYGGPNTDLEKLQAELAGATSSQDDEDEYEDEWDDPYAKYYEDEDEDDDASPNDDEEPPARQR